MGKREKLKAGKAREVVNPLCSTRLQSVGVLAVQDGFGVVPSIPDGNGNVMQAGCPDCPKCGLRAVPFFPDGAVQNRRDACQECL